MSPTDTDGSGILEVGVRQGIWGRKFPAGKGKASGDLLQIIPL